MVNFVTKAVMDEVKTETESFKAFKKRHMKFNKLIEMMDRKQFEKGQEEF